MTDPDFIAAMAVGIPLITPPITPPAGPAPAEPTTEQDAE